MSLITRFVLCYSNMYSFVMELYLHVPGFLYNSDGRYLFNMDILVSMYMLYSTDDDPIDTYIYIVVVIWMT